MIPVSLEKLKKILNAKLVGANNQIINITTDTRNIVENCLFIALKGKNFDAHDFIKEAKTASAYLVNRKLTLNVPQLIVQNTTLALETLAAWVRQQVKTRVVAITGSSGKTSVKEMTAAILKQCGTVLYTHGNYNNNIGVSLTLLQLQMKHDFAVIELGGNHIGEIAYTSKLTRPVSALINNLSASHIEGFGSILHIAQAKSEIFTGLLNNGIAIINYDNNNWNQWKDILNNKIIWRFSLKSVKKVEFFAKNIKINNNGTQFKLYSPFGFINIKLPLLGYHNIENALAATALAVSVGASLEAVKKGLKNVRALSGRIFPIILATNKLLLDDTYNANIGSMIAAIKVLSDMPGYKIMVVGDMMELGEYTEIYHRQIGKIISSSNIEKIISVGNFSSILSTECIHGEHYKNKKTAIIRIKELLIKHNIITILIKGSRLSKMEQIVSALQEQVLC